MDFGLARFDTINRTRRLELPEISADPTAPLTLIVAQCHHGNSRYASWILKNAPSDESTMPALGTPERREMDDERTTAMVASAAIVDWENVLDDGQPAPCTPEAAVEFMRQLRAARRDVFLRIGYFVIDPANWTSTASPTDSAALGKE
jgi:hypothetical protein